MNISRNIHRLIIMSTVLAISVIIQSCGHSFTPDGLADVCIKEAENSVEGAENGFIPQIYTIELKESAANEHLEDLYYEKVKDYNEKYKDTKQLLQNVNEIKTIKAEASKIIHEHYIEELKANASEYAGKEIPVTFDKELFGAATAKISSIGPAYVEVQYTITPLYRTRGAVTTKLHTLDERGNISHSIPLRINCGAGETTTGITYLPIKDLGRASALKVSMHQW